MNLADLKAPFAPSKISWRVGSTTKDKTKGMALAYIDARDVQDRLESVCGPNWQCRYVPMHDKKTVCEIGIRIPRPVGNEDYTNASEHEWIWRSDGAGDSDIEAEKGALSDSFKRAAVRWGIGRYLYDLESPWVELDTYEKDGKTFAKGIKAHEYKRLEALLASGPKPTQRDAIHGASTLKDPDPPPPPVTTMTPQTWAQTGIDRVNNFKTLQDLDTFERKFAAKIVLIAPKVPDLHAKLVSLMADKRASLEGLG